MTIKEALFILIDAIEAEDDNYDITPDVIQEVITVAIPALKKQIPQNPGKLTYKLLVDAGWEYKCPFCERAVGKNMNDIDDFTQEEPYCANCGQALEWRNQNE